MILAISLVVAVLFGSGAFLLLQRDLLRMVVGMVLISNSAILFIIASELTRGAPPILPLAENQSVSDPLVQAMALTAIVIGSTVAALLLALVYRIYISEGTVDLKDISEAEMREAEALESEGDPEREEEPEEGPAAEEREERSR